MLCPNPNKSPEASGAYPDRAFKILISAFPLIPTSAICGNSLELDLLMMFGPIIATDLGSSIKWRSAWERSQFPIRGSFPAPLCPSHGFVDTLCSIAPRAEKKDFRFRKFSAVNSLLIFAGDMSPFSERSST